ncbi:ABC transporter transmembrane domain-containing protein, partial [Scardovia wiggsiae]
MSVVVVCIILSAVANAAMGLFLQRLIDSYILPLVGKANPNFIPLVQALGVMAIIFTAGILSTLLYNRILVRVEQGVLKTIRDDMFVHQQALPIK